MLDVFFGFFFYIRWKCTETNVQKQNSMWHEYIVDEPNICYRAQSDGYNAMIQSTFVASLF